MQRKRFCHKAVTLVAFGLLVSGAGNASVAAQEAGETAFSAQVVESRSGGVVAADHPIASQMGARILRAGGNATDAAVASLLTLGVVNPFSSGLGGGGFCIVRQPDGEVDVLDFRERAPGKAHRDMYVENGEAQIGKMVYGGLAVGVPGEARGLEALHQKHGQAKWSAVVQPAWELSLNGFPVGEKLASILKSRGERLDENSPALAAVFKSKDGAWLKQGEVMVRPGLAKTLKSLSEKGAQALYEGEIAKAIVQTVDENGGIFVDDDLASYRVTWRDPVVGDYRGYEIIAMPPPSSGGTTILAALNILERYDLQTLGYNPESIHRITEALKHAFADRAMWLGDADFVSVPVERLTSEAYANERTVLPSATLPLEAYGTSAQLPDDDGTTHVSVIDADGGMAACTSTINTGFGSMVFVEKYGLILNNEMADFTAQPGVPNNYGLVGTAQNAVAPGKRPLSSMSPTLIVKDGNPVMAIGASGGPTIITGTLLAIIRTLDWGWSPLAAIAMPRIHHQWRPNTLRVEQLPEAWRQVLTERGHEIELRDAYNSVQMVLRTSDGSLTGVSDPRKKGEPAAQ